MKLIHCADLHLGSRMESGLPPEKARERRMELLHTFVNMVDTCFRRRRGSYVAVRRSV